MSFKKKAKAQQKHRFDQTYQHAIKTTIPAGYRWYRMQHGKTIKDTKKQEILPTVQ